MKIQFFKTLAPSWSFFDQVGDQPLIKWSLDGALWHELSFYNKTPIRTSIFFNPIRNQEHFIRNTVMECIEKIQLGLELEIIYDYFDECLNYLILHQIDELEVQMANHIFVQVSVFNPYLNKSEFLFDRTIKANR